MPGNEIRALVQDVTMKILFLVLFSVYTKAIQGACGQELYTKWPI